ncbi:MAG: FAD:protein FMN transferase [Caldilineaceae bacterium]|nr:FAD:protein FMN transferase [Caldilineaceae bacterium]
MLREHHFRAMNTDVGVWLWDGPSVGDQLLRDVEKMFREAENQLSRFRVDSDLSRLNQRAGRGEQNVSPLLLRVLVQALAAARRTEGIFDPTVLPQLRQAGYDRSFELLEDENSPACPAVDCRVAPCSTRGGWRNITIHQAGSTVSLPAGMALDLGGIGKGWTVDRASEMLTGWGPALVDAGGDMRASGLPGGEGWPVAVQDPFHPERDLLTLTLADCSAATSTVGRRTWLRNGQRFHHLIDPRTGQPSASDLHTVTVVAPCAAEAEVAAKTVLLLGSDPGAAWLLQQGHAGLLITRSGTSTVVGQLPIGKRGEQ